MNHVFPFGFPLPTAFYVTIYVLTLALHHAFMHYVLAGSIYVAWAAWFPGLGARSRDQQPLARMLSDWMPFMLSAAITAGVAPLLFIQIVYPRHFYTANVLLSWRWMIVIPVLIAAFYLLYVNKSSDASKTVRALAAGTSAAFFLFVGFCWTANYFFTASENHWPELFRSGAMPFEVGQVLLRMTIWLAGSFATMALILAWQLGGNFSDSENMNASQQLARMSLVGLCVAMAAATAYLFVSSDIHWKTIRPLCLPYLIAAAAGAIGQVAMWRVRSQSFSWNRTWLVVTTLAMAITLISVAVARESIRLGNVNLTALYTHHAESSEIGGRALFVVFTLVNGGLIAWCVWIVRNASKRMKAD